MQKAPRLKCKLLLTESLVRRFWEKTSKLGPNDCWPFSAYEESHGHRRIWAQFDDGKYRNASAHRVAMSIAGIDLPEDCEVCHKCNNPQCVNTNHLYVGDRQTNAADVVAAGTNKGENNGAHRLTAREARSIRWLRSIGMTLEDIAVVFACDYTNIALICTGKTWTEAGGPDCTKMDSRRKFSEWHLSSMAWLIRQGFLTKDIAFLFGCSTTYVLNLSKLQVTE